MTRVTALPFPPAHSALPTPQPTLLLFKAAIVGALRRATSDDGLWGRVPLVIQLAYVAFIHGRVEDLMAKLSFVWMTSATSWTIKAMRKPYTRLLLALQLLFLPVLLALAATGAILASPLVPLFGLPLFALGFPRPKRFAAKVCIYVHEAGKRPGEGGGAGEAERAARQCLLRPGIACLPLAPLLLLQYSNVAHPLLPFFPFHLKIAKNLQSGSDAVYYEQVLPAVKAYLGAAFRSGHLGSVAPGSVFLMRFETRMLLTQVLEVSSEAKTTARRSCRARLSRCAKAEWPI